ncbi:hypothetical protein OUZ56_026474 [Daphnia magna]|uniref:Uncharacterized protein n=1 Tax=Daphnia magna TaxID=35525 RepID=A0ABQ9ZLW1_9CRUS|nr:hypothetical protein OUZ56_026474 [Daphnia magna]
MEVDSFQFLLRKRGNFDDVLQLMGALLFSSPFRFYARLRPEDKELVVQLLLFSLLNNLCAPPSAYDFGFQRVWIGDYYYVRYPGYARYRDLYPQHLARLLWWPESDEDIFYPAVLCFYLNVFWRNLKILSRIMM